MLQREAFHLTHGSYEEDDMIEWCEEMIAKSPTFKFWDFVMTTELHMLLFVRSHRERNFDLYIETLEALCPLFFALDHVNYARWVPIHIRDMKSLPESIQSEFQNGHWVVTKTNRVFSSIPIDQAHEQENKNVKGTGGIIGLTESPSALRLVLCP